MKPIEEILKEVEEYEKLKAEACICLPSETLWSEASNKFVTFSLEWTPETIIRELVEENKRLNNVLFYHGIKD